MFIGHYSVSYAIKSYKPEVPFWALLIGVQFVDVLFMIFVPLGIEKVRLVPGFTAFNSYDLYFMPYTHSLLGHIIWAILAFLVFRFVVINSGTQRQKNIISGLIALSVFSHYIFDLIVHTPDLPLASDESLKLGFGLWNYRYLSTALEFILIGTGIYLYFTKSKGGPGFGGKYGMIIFSAILILITLGTSFMPTPKSTTELAIQGFLSYILIAIMGGWLDGKRKWTETI